MSFYTGLPSLEILKKTFSFVSPRVIRCPLLLSKCREFVLVLIKLRLGVPHQDLAYRFNVSRAVVSRMIVIWLTVMDLTLSSLISWQDREQLHRTMNKGWKFLKKLWCCVGGGSKVIWLYQLSWKCKLATVTCYKADVSSVSPSSER